jgi:hypothetical protein
MLELSSDYTGMLPQHQRASSSSWLHLKMFVLIVLGIFKCVLLIGHAAITML